MQNNRRVEQAGQGLILMLNDFRCLLVALLLMLLIASWGLHALYSTESEFVTATASLKIGQFFHRYTVALIQVLFAPVGAIFFSVMLRVHALVCATLKATVG